MFPLKSARATALAASLTEMFPPAPRDGRSRTRRDAIERPEIVVLSKTDVCSDTTAIDRAREALAKRGIEPLSVSAATGAGIDELVGRIFETVARARREDEAAESNETRAGAEAGPP